VQKDLKVCKFREREVLPAAWWRQLAELALLLILVGILTQGCDKLPPNVWPPADCRLWQTAIQAMPDGAARDAAQAEFDRAHPEGCPVEPTSPPVTQPSPEPTDEPTAPPTPAAGCVLPDQAGWVVSRDQSPVRLELVRAWVATVQREHPDWFTDGGGRLASRSAAGVDALYDELGRVAARDGYCAGQIREHEGRLDKFGVMQPGGGLEAYHLVEYGGFRLQNPIKVNSVWVPPAGTPPVTTPTPAPTATPDSGCGAPVPPPLGEWGLKCWEPRPGTTTCDATPKVRGRDYCASVGYTDGRNACAVRPDCNPATQACRFPDRAECEALIVGGLPVWTWSGDPSQYEPRGPYTVQVSTKSPGVLRVCNPAGTVCNQRVQR
jgi:hypothetical protein